MHSFTANGGELVIILTSDIELWYCPVFEVINDVE